MIRDFLPLPDLLSYLEAILRVYNRHGRRDNIHKARIKILVKALGIEHFREQVEAEWQAARDYAPRLEASEVDRVRVILRAARLREPAGHRRCGRPQAGVSSLVSIQHPRAQGAWLPCGVRFSEAHGDNPGDITSDQMDAVANLADRFSFGMIRVPHNQNLLLGDVEQDDLPLVWEELRGLGLAMPNIGTLTDMIACPGLDFCSLANAGTLNVAKQIQQRFDDLDYLYDLGDIEIKMSGCMNACGHHHVGHIGILGVDKHGEEWYQITLGGSVNGFTALGEVIGPSVPQNEVAATIERIVECLSRRRAKTASASSRHSIG